MLVEMNFKFEVKGKEFNLDYYEAQDLYFGLDKIFKNRTTIIPTYPITIPTYPAVTPIITYSDGTGSPDLPFKHIV